MSQEGAPSSEAERADVLEESVIESLTAVVPVYAETDPLVDVVEGLIRELGDVLHEVRIILAAQAPTTTRAICMELADRIEVVHMSEQEHGPGLGWAVRQGIAESRGTHILLIDGDGEMDVKTVPAMVRLMEERGADLVVGSRWIPGGGAKGYSRPKRILNRGFQVIFRALYRTTLHDLTLGFKLGRGSMFKQLPWRGEFHEIACETTLRPLRAEYKVLEVPTVWRRRTEGTSSNPIRRNFRYVTTALRILFEFRATQ